MGGITMVKDSGKAFGTPPRLVTSPYAAPMRSGTASPWTAGGLRTLPAPVFADEEKAINTLSPGDMAVSMYNDLDTCQEEEIFSPGSWEKAAVASEATEALWFSTSTAAREPAVETSGAAPANNEVQDPRGVVAGA